MIAETSVGMMLSPSAKTFTSSYHQSVALNTLKYSLGLPLYHSVGVSEFTSETPLSEVNKAPVGSRSKAADS